MAQEPNKEVAYDRYIADIAKILLANSVVIGLISAMMMLLLNLVRYMYRVVGKSGHKKRGRVACPKFGHPALKFRNSALSSDAFFLCSDTLH